MMEWQTKSHRRSNGCLRGAESRHSAFFSASRLQFGSIAPLHALSFTTYDNTTRDFLREATLASEKACNQSHLLLTFLIRLC